ncbi:MAG: retropepsin-like aspartic protease [Chitinophagaceae bacterium]
MLKGLFPLPSALLGLWLLWLLPLPALGKGHHVVKYPPLITSFPFQQLTDGVIIIRAQVKPYPDTLNFILDTGSGGISLDSTTCAKMKFKVTPSNQIIHGIGGSSKAFFVLDYPLELPGLEVDHLDFHISDYSLISAVYGVPIDGIIGYSFFKRYTVRIDYDKMRVMIYQPGPYPYGKGGELLKPILPSIPIIQAPLKNKRTTHTRYYFDTGAGMCLLLSNAFVQDSSVLDKRNRRHRIIHTEAQGLLGKMNMSITTMHELWVGKYGFFNVPTYMFDDVSNVTAYPYLGGLIGNDLLRRFNLVLNYARDEIYIQPNTHFFDRFDYSYTGLILYFLDGQVQITDVMPGSPAAKAGLKPGDLVLGVGNNFNNNIQQYLELLKNIGDRVRIVILRKGKPEIKNLPIKSFL